jgi:hypothetical protein
VFQKQPSTFAVPLRHRWIVALAIYALAIVVVVVIW